MTGTFILLQSDNDALPCSLNIRVCLRDKEPEHDTGEQDPMRSGLDYISGKSNWRKQLGRKRDGMIKSNSGQV